tara:strand:- start:458 stop:811 length:354 start_codon:yes stop_codon:yes gene_type:complete
MDYLVMRDIAVIVFMTACVGVAFYSSIKFSRDVQNIEAGHRDDMMELLRHSIDTIKSTSLEERVNAVALEGQHEVQLEMMRDAMEQERELALASEPTPQFAQTASGDRINMNEYEIL